MANIHPRATKSHSWNIRLEPPTHRSVGRLSALYHRLLLQLCKLRHNSPPQDRLHRSKVATLAGQTPNIPHRQLSELFIRLPSLLCSPVNGLQSRLARLASLYQSTPCKPSWGVCQPPKTHRKRNSKQDHCPIMEKSARRSFSNKPPLERITSHFVILPRQIAFFGLCIYH